jgi:hypothetical protein
MLGVPPLANDWTNDNDPNIKTKFSKPH